MRKNVRHPRQKIYYTFRDLRLSLSKIRRRRKIQKPAAAATDELQNPDDTLNPLFPATTEHHLSFGLGYLVGNKTWDFAIEHAFEAENTNNNTDPMVNPFGPGTTVTHSQWTFAIGLSWALDR